MVSDFSGGAVLFTTMDERQRLLALLEVSDEAIQELYVLGDPCYVELILRLERRHQDAASRPAELERREMETGPVAASAS